MSSIDSYSSLLGVSVETLGDYTSDELKALIDEKLDGLSDADRSTFLDDLNNELDELKNGLEDLQNGTEDVINDAQDNQNNNDADTIDFYQSIEDKGNILLEEIDAVSATIDDIEAAAEDEVQYYSFTHVSTSEDYNLTIDTSSLDTIKDGDTIHFEGTGGDGGGMFANGTVDSNGEVIAGTQKVDTNGDGTLDTVVDANGDNIPDQDFNLDGYTNYTDLTFGMASIDPATNGKQNLFFDVPAGAKTSGSPEYPSYDAATNTTTFAFTKTEDGVTKTFYVEVTGDVNIIFTGSNYIDGVTNGDFSALESWPPEVLKCCYDGTGDATSFYGHLHPDELTDEDRRGALGGYAESSAGIASAISTLEGYLATSTADKDSVALALPSGAEATIQEMLDAFYDTDILNGNVSGTMTADEAWAAIMDAISGYSPEQQAALMSTFVYTLAMNDPANFKSLMATKITTIEAIICYADNDAAGDATNIGSFEKFIVTLMEMQGGSVGIYGGSAMMTNGLAYAPAEGEEGAWKNQTENEQALAWYNTFLTTSGVGSDAAALAALQNEQGISGNANDGNALNDNLNLEQTEIDQLASTMMAAVDPSKVPSAGGNVALGILTGGIGLIFSTTPGITQEEYQTELSGLIDTFFANLSGGQTVNQAMDSIKSYINSLDSAHANDILSSFIYLLDESAKKQGLDIAKQIFADKDFNNWCSSKIEYNVNAKPAYYDQALAVLQKYNTSKDSYANKATDNKQINIGNQSNDYDSAEAEDKAKDEGFWDKAEDVGEDILDFF